MNRYLFILLFIMHILREAKEFVPTKWPDKCTLNECTAIALSYKHKLCDNYSDIMLQVFKAFQKKILELGS